VIHVKELMWLLDHYERLAKDKDIEGYTRKEGSYLHTFQFSPEWLCILTLQNLVGDCIPDVQSTMDGLIVHPCFREEVVKEHEDFIQHFSRLGHPAGNEDLDEFYDAAYESSPFRMMYEDAGMKDIYLPSKKEFLRYADASYYEKSLAEKDFEKYLKRRFRQTFEAEGKKVGLSTEQVISDFLADIHSLISDAGSGESADINEVISYLMDFMSNRQVPFKNLEEANEYLGYGMNMINSVRLWSNHGHTPTELALIQADEPGQSGPVTIVPGSSRAAGMLEESRDEIEKMGFQVDLESNAARIPAFTFDNGPEGNMKVTSKKVYPNDPCPCGSGKKYKKCCGRR